MSELILDKYTFYPICKNLQGKVVTFFRTKKQTEKTSQNLYTRSTFMIEDAKDLDSEVFPGFTLSYTNFSDVLFVQDIGYSELKRMVIYFNTYEIRRGSCLGQRFVINFKVGFLH
jgi:hypothetical protein